MDFVCMGERVVGITQGRGVGGGASGSWDRGLWLMHGSRMLDVHGLGHLVQDVEPGQVGRRRWEVEDTARDVELLWWISRFRFVSADLVAGRFGISVQRSRARLRRVGGVGGPGGWGGGGGGGKSAVGYPPGGGGGRGAPPPPPPPAGGRGRH